MFETCQGALQCSVQIAAFAKNITVLRMLGPRPPVAAVCGFRKFGRPGVPFDPGIRGRLPLCRRLQRRELLTFFKKPGSCHEALLVAPGFHVHGDHHRRARKESPGGKHPGELAFLPGHSPAIPKPEESEKTECQGHQREREQRVLHRAVCEGRSAGKEHHARRHGHLRNHDRRCGFGHRGARSLR
jgi:hypothetical protein